LWEHIIWYYIEEEIIRVLLRVKVNDAIARSDLLDWRRDYGEI